VEKYLILPAISTTTSISSATSYCYYYYYHHYYYYYYCYYYYFQYCQSGTHIVIFYYFCYDYGQMRPASEYGTSQPEGLTQLEIRWHLSSS